VLEIALRTTVLRYRHPPNFVIRIINTAVKPADDIIPMYRVRDIYILVNIAKQGSSYTVKSPPMISSL